MTFKTEKDFLALQKANIKLVSGYQFLQPQNMVTFEMALKIFMLHLGHT